MRPYPLVFLALAACGSAQTAPITTTTTTVAPLPDEAAIPDVASAPAVDASSAPAVDEDAGPWLSGDARRAQVMAVVERYRDVGGCWSDALERDANHAPEAARVAVVVSASGQGTVTVDGVSDGALGECIRVRLAGHRYGAGDGVTADASYDLAPGG